MIELVQLFVFLMFMNLSLNFFQVIMSERFY